MGAAPPSAARSSARRRILVIEHNIDAAHSLRDALELDDHTVVVAFNGVEGIKRAHEFNPDIVLCDIGLPGMNGYDVAKAFRADEVGESDEEDAAEGRHEGQGGWVRLPRRETTDVGETG